MWRRVCALKDLRDGEGHSVQVDGVEVGVYRCGEELFAVENICTHAHAYLHEGSVDRVRCTVECPLHGAEFDLRSGAVLSPPAEEALRVFAVRVVGDEVQVDIPEASGEAAEGRAKS
jgi:nitrite reductase/ring-hydroxylating ferredoxin subunit